MPQAIDRSSRLHTSPPHGLNRSGPASSSKLDGVLGSSAIAARAGARTTLDEFIGRLLELRARGAGALPVVIESRSRTGDVIYGEANARRDRLVRVGAGFRNLDAAIGELAEVVRVG